MIQITLKFMEKKTYITPEMECIVPDTVSMLAASNDVYEQLGDQDQLVKPESIDEVW